MQLTLTLSSREDMQAAYDLLGAALGLDSDAGTVELQALPPSTPEPLSPEVRQRIADGMAKPEEKAPPEETEEKQSKRKYKKLPKVELVTKTPPTPEELLAARKELKEYFVPIATRFGEEPFRKIFKDVGAQAIRDLNTLEAVAQVRSGIEKKAEELEAANELGTSEA